MNLIVVLFFSFLFLPRCLRKPFNFQLKLNAAINSMLFWAHTNHTCSLSSCFGYKRVSNRKKNSSFNRNKINYFDEILKYIILSSFFKFV